MPTSPLHITVAAVPNAEFGNPRILDHELRLVKASILYADGVKLCSFGAWMAASFYFVGNLPMNEVQKLELLINFAPALSALDPNAVDLSGLQKLHMLFKRNPITLTKRERQTKANFRRSFPEIWERFREGIDQVLSKFGFNEIKLVADQGLLEIHPFSNFNVDELPLEYVSVVEDMLASPTTHPMLDQQTSDLVRFGIQEGKMFVGKGGVKKGKQIGLVADLFDRLPVFDVGMDELLDLRAELGNPLVRFRAAMTILSSDIESASWDEEFPSDVQTVVQAKIEPAILEIEEKLKSTVFQDFWSKRIVDKYGYIAGSLGLSYAVGAAIAPLAGITTALVAAGIFAKAGYSELKEKKGEIERNELYFYYRMKDHVN